LHLALRLKDYFSKPLVISKIVVTLNPSFMQTNWRQ